MLALVHRDTQLSLMMEVKVVCQNVQENEML
jgi:hypothetical protein